MLGPVLRVPTRDQILELVRRIFSSLTYLKCDTILRSVELIYVAPLYIIAFK